MSDDTPEELLDELDSIKELLDIPEPEPEVEPKAQLEPEAEAEPEPEPEPEPVPTLDEEVPTLDEAIPVLEMVDEGEAGPVSAVPPREELEALVEILIERRLPAIREQLKAELMADLGLEG